MTQPPIARSLASLSPTDDWLEADIGPAPDGWLRAGDVGHDPAVLAELEGRTRAAIGARDRLSLGAMMVWRWGEVGRVASVLFLRHRRVPDLDPERVAFVPYTDESPTRVRLASAAFACLADDPDAENPDATPLPSLHELRAELVRQVERFVEPAIEPIGAATGLGRKPSWGLAAGAALVTLAETIAQEGDPNGAARELDALLAEADRFAVAPPSAEVFVHAGGAHLAVRLGACCRAWRWLDRPGQKCAFCPILSRDERLARHLEPENHASTACASRPSR